MGERRDSGHRALLGTTGMTPLDTALRCVFCGTEVAPSQCQWVRLLDDEHGFVCCPTVCPPMRDAIETQRRAVAARRHQLDLPLPAA